MSMSRYDETQRWGPWYLSEMEEKWWRIKLEKRIKTLRSDNGSEYTSDPFFEVC
jgi:transposase InsO family protein